MSITDTQTLSTLTSAFKEKSLSDLEFSYPNTSTWNFEAYGGFEEEINDQIIEVSLAFADDFDEQISHLTAQLNIKIDMQDYEFFLNLAEDSDLKKVCEFWPEAKENLIELFDQFYEACIGEFEATSKFAGDVENAREQQQRLQQYC